MKKFLIFTALVVVLFFLMSPPAYGFTDEEKKTIKDIASEYELCPEMILAIATLESGHGESELAKNKHNYFGWFGNNGEYMEFDSLEECTRHIAKAFTKRAHGTLEEVAGWYNPAYADVWVKRVRECQKEANRSASNGKQVKKKQTYQKSSGEKLILKMGWGERMKAVVRAKYMKIADMLKKWKA